MKIYRTLILASLSILTFTSCDSDDDNSTPTTPLNEEVNMTMRNTLQDPGEDEGTYPALFGQPDDAYDEMATLSNSTIEFATALAQNGTPAGDVNGLYSIDFTESTISYSLIADPSDPFWANIADVFGVFPNGKFDRYYYTFSEPHNISSFTTNNSSVNLRIDSDTVIVVEISEGFVVTPGASFSIILN
ncbi:hypothetical protein [uncultured Psychroserpens sp.]|uniref:hypothetical protein n=1 Tax=uncultured Psychroserpens sp. TaxID=255436 RepID=UPI00261AF3AC|nr:hypothetical protein [uncultured Psychroserpens sp.]